MSALSQINLDSSLLELEKTIAEDAGKSISFVKFVLLLESSPQLVKKIIVTNAIINLVIFAPFCQRQSASSGLVRKNTVTSAVRPFDKLRDLNHRPPVTLSSDFIQFQKTKRGMVSLGLYYEGSGKPATLSTTAYQAIKPRLAVGKRPTTHTRSV